jgi:hypothetical protein
MVHYRTSSSSRRNTNAAPALLRPMRRRVLRYVVSSHLRARCRTTRQFMMVTNATNAPSHRNVTA